MKNTKKGFIIPLIIIVLVLAISGGSYVYLKKEEIPQSAITSTEDVVINEPASNNPNLGNINNDKKNITKDVGKDIEPSITVLSPNGGEKWISGQSQTIRWKYSSLSDLVQEGKRYPVMVSVGLQYQDVSLENPDEYGGGRLCVLAQIPISTGSFTFNSSIGACPNLNSSRPVIKSGNYKITLSAYYQGRDGDFLSRDESDKSFTLSLSDVNTTTTQQPPHIDSVTPIVDINGNVQFTVTGTGFTGSRPYVDGQGATFIDDYSLTDTTILLISVKQLSTSGKHSVYLINPAGQKSNVVDFTK